MRTVSHLADAGGKPVRAMVRKPVSYISYKDVARFAVESLENPAAKNAILELGGPEQLSQLDVVKFINLNF